MIVHYNGDDDDGDGNICGDNRQKDEPCFPVLIHLDFASHTHTSKEMQMMINRRGWTFKR